MFAFTVLPEAETFQFSELSFLQPENAATEPANTSISAVIRKIFKRFFIFICPFGMSFMIGENSDLFLHFFRPDYFPSAASSDLRTQSAVETLVAIGIS